jgi:hypothetical protein
MVPLTSVHGLLLRDVERTLVATLETATDDVDIAFRSWLLAGTPHPGNAAACIERALRHRGAERSYRDIAVLAFAVSSGADNVVADLESGSAWLAGTSAYLSGVPTGIVEDRVALLGIALGLKVVGEDTRARLSRWIEPLAIANPHDTDVTRSLLRAIFVLLNRPIPQAGAAEAELALARKGVLQISDDDLAVRVVDALLGGDIADEPQRAAMQLAALTNIRERLPTIAVQRPDVADVATLLRGMPRSLAQWTWEERPATRGGTARQWHVDHEYHVQNLLWVLLAPIFPDLRREEYTDAVGPLQPRIDLGVPSLRLLIEAKFWRRSLSASKLVEQIASDVSIYFATARAYDSLLVFIWDDARRTEEHALVERAMKQLQRVADVVIVPRPAKMPRQADD